jgi:hypothetical protein
MLVSRGEFIAFGCHISHTPQVIGAFNLSGEEMWEQNMTESYVSPTFSYAPGSGRFAMSRVLTRSSLVDSDSFSPEMFDGQVVTIYQTDSGRQLLRIDASPIARAGQNFALSPDGMSFAIVRNNALEIYSLPPLTSEERKAVQMAEASAPPIDGDPAMLLSDSGSTPSRSGNTGSTAPTPQPPAPVDAGSSSSASDGAVPPASSTAPADPAAATQTPAAARPSEGTGEEKTTAPSTEGDVPQQPRRPPTLYGPGESRGNDPAHRDNPK